MFLLLRILKWMRRKRYGRRVNPVLEEDLSSTKRWNPLKQSMRFLKALADIWREMIKAVICEAFALFVRGVDGICRCLLGILQSIGMMEKGMNAKRSPIPLFSLFNAPSSRATGLLEDLQLLLMTCVDESYEMVVVMGKVLYCTITGQWQRIWYWMTTHRGNQQRLGFTSFVDDFVVQPIRLRISQLLYGGIDDRGICEFVQSVGFPYEKYIVETEDGHLLPLDRLSNKKSVKVVYFQHGVLDTAYAWISCSSGVSASNCAFVSFQRGFDVFLGNFRGTRERRHSDIGISAKKYWDFSLNEHGNDVESIINTIRAIKSEEGVPLDKIKITIVAHSLGAAAALIYVTHKRQTKVPHYIDEMVLFSPAGVHRNIPWLCVVLGPVIRMTLARWVCGFRLPAKSVAAVSAKVLQDLRRVPATRDLVSLVLVHLIGGDVRLNAFSQIGNFGFNVMLSGTSSKVLEHFMQIFSAKKFQLFDYGTKSANLVHYGSPYPPNVLDLYHLIDIPVHFLCGEEDRLIPPEDVYLHYDTLKRSRPDLSHFKCLSGMSHLGFTYGQDAQLIQYLLSILD